MWSKEGEEISRGTYKNGEPWEGRFVGGVDEKQHIKFLVYKDGQLVQQ